MLVLSRAFVLASIAFLAPPGASAHRTTRRSLSFRPHLGSDFFTDPLPIPGPRDPHQVAHAFLTKLSYPSDGYFIRKDSYTDKNTGISHIYVQQVVNGVEVVDGSINLNIRDGQVLSHGNSFFEGSVEADVLSVPNWHQAVYCSESTARDDPACGGALDHLQAIASRHTSDLARHHNDPRAAAFFFMQVAHPDPASLALNTFEVEHHGCTDLLDDGASCQNWVLTAQSGGLEPIHVRQVYVQTPGANGSTYLNLAWRLETYLPDNHYVAYVSVHDPSKIISMTDLIVEAPAPNSEAWQNTLQHHVFGQGDDIAPSRHHVSVNPTIVDSYSGSPKTGSYRVWKWGVNDPASGQRTLEAAPSDRKSSPLGWHSMPARNDPLRSHLNLDGNTVVSYTTTVGNNVMVQQSVPPTRGYTREWKNRHRPDAGSNLKFDFPYNENAQPRDNIDASLSQAFYTANMYHDLLYQYGFDEASGNFQQHNFGKEGVEDDAVIVLVQDGPDVNNALFDRAIKTADGQKPFCRMFIFTHSQPNRDGGFDAGVLIHELTHGLSGRLTGGPSRPDCLDSHDAKGMGEGWSDFIATTVRSTKEYSDYPIGAWAFKNKEGIRGLPYSKHMEINNWTYHKISDYRRDRQEHPIRAVWAEILYVVSNMLIDKHGFAPSLFPSTRSGFYRLIARDDGVLAEVPKHGNTLMLQLVVNALKTQPCNPSFIQARDAIIAADKALTGGENKCTLWKGFASRGMGTDALTYDPYSWNSLDGFKIPSDC